MTLQEKLDKLTEEYSKKIRDALGNKNYGDIFVEIQPDEGILEIDEIEELIKGRGVDFGCRFCVFIHNGHPSSRENVSFFTLSQLPGCCAYIVSHNCRVLYNFQNLGIGLILNNFRVELAKLLGFTGIMCTDVATNTKQRKILAKNDWIDVDTLVNKRTKNTVHLSIKHI